ncbi:hypothetical protein D3C80_1812530 [compost metagenome]
MRQQGDLERMLGNVLRCGAAHEAPTLNILEAVKIGGKMVVQFLSNPFHAELSVIL